MARPLPDELDVQVGSLPFDAAPSLDVVVDSIRIDQQRLKAESCPARCPASDLLCRATDEGERVARSWIKVHDLNVKGPAVLANEVVQDLSVSLL